MIHGTKTLAVATALLSLPLLAMGQTSNMQNQNSQSNSRWSQSASGNHRSAEMEAKRMVPVNATLIHSIDGSDMHPGQLFTARISKDVTLSNGTKLQDGAKLVGKVVTDNMNQQGTSKLALRVIRIEMQNGKIVPVKATIVGVYKGHAYPYMRPTVPNSWNDGTLQVIQKNATEGVDLHSSIGSRNSGVFVSSSDSNIKLDAGTQLHLAVAPRMHGNSSNSMNNGA